MFWFILLEWLCFFLSLIPNSTSTFFNFPFYFFRNIQPNNTVEPASSSPEINNDSNNKLVTKKVKQLDGYVGFANLPNQVYRKAVKKGFEFTLMVVGESGLGKSTLINSMFLTDVYSADYPGPSQRLKKTVDVETHKVLLKESGVNLTLTIVDTPGTKFEKKAFFFTT